MNLARHMADHIVVALCHTGSVRRMWRIGIRRYKQSGMGRELGSYALDNYTQVKSVLWNYSGADD